MNKEEILKKSRVENKNKDLYAKELSLVAAKWGMTCALILATIFFIIQVCIGDGLNWGLYAVVFSLNAGVRLYESVKFRKRNDIILTIAYFFIVSVASIRYVMDLIK